MLNDKLEAENNAAQLIQNAINYATPAQTFNKVEITCMYDIEMKPIHWMWPERIASGKITVIAGNPGLGKSQITAWLAARVSKGMSWPDSHKALLTANAAMVLESG